MSHKGVIKYYGLEKYEGEINTLFEATDISILNNRPLYPSEYGFYSSSEEGIEVYFNEILDNNEQLRDELFSMNCSIEFIYIDEDADLYYLLVAKVKFRGLSGSIRFVSQKHFDYNLYGWYQAEKYYDLLMGKSSRQGKNNLYDFKSWLENTPNNYIMECLDKPNVMMWDIIRDTVPTLVKEVDFTKGYILYMAEYLSKNFYDGEYSKQEILERI